MKRALLLVALLCLGASSAAADVPHLLSIPEGTYRAVVPPGWDGKRPLPVVMYLHGYREDSALITGNSELVAAATSLGALFVVPDGIDQGWSHVGAPRRKRDDIAFLHAVLADVGARWPVNKARVFAAGFSIGGSMVWDLACHGAQGFAAFLPFSGGFWLPYPERCETGPFDLRHTHAVNDHTFPMEGRPLFGQFHQGDVHKGFALLEATDGCDAEPDAKTREGALDCQTWSHCSSGKQLEMCLHNGDHQIQGGWLRQSVEWAVQRVAARS